MYSVRSPPRFYLKSPDCATNVTLIGVKNNDTGTPKRARTAGGFFGLTTMRDLRHRILDMSDGFRLLKESAVMEERLRLCPRAKRRPRPRTASICGLLVCLLAVVCGADCSGGTAEVVVGTGTPQPLPPEVIPFAQPPLATMQASGKLVVAHWHQFPISRDKGSAERDSYARMLAGDDDGMGIRLRPLGRPARSGDWERADALVDIRWAQAIGVDAFLINLATDMKNWWAWPEYIRYLQAARQLGTGFRIAPNIDCVDPESGRGMAEAIVAKLRDAGELASPSQLRVKGKFVVGAFYANNCGVPYWTEFKGAMKAAGLDPLLVCVMLGGAYRPEFDGVCDAWSDWGRKDPWSASASAYASRYAGVKDEPIMAAISPGDVRYRRDETIAYEQKGSETLRINWEEAIDDRRGLGAARDLERHRRAFGVLSEHRPAVRDIRPDGVLHRLVQDREAAADHQGRGLLLPSHCPGATGSAAPLRLVGQRGRGGGVPHRAGNRRDRHRRGDHPKRFPCRHACAERAAPCRRQAPVPHRPQWHDGRRGDQRLRRWADARSQRRRLPRRRLAPRHGGGARQRRKRLPQRPSPTSA